MATRKIKDEATTAQDKIDFGLLNNHIYFLTGDITEASVNGVIKWIVYENAINPKSKLTLYINSEGGSVGDAFALIDVMRNSKCRISTIGLGSICSCGFFIFAAGAKGNRYIAKNTSILCHQFSATMDAKFHDLEAFGIESKLTNQRLTTLLVESSGLSASEVKKKLLTASDVWLTAEELVEYGIADVVIN